MNNFLRILSGFALVNLLRSLIPFCLLPILTRALTPSEYGLLSICDATILILVPLMLFNSQGFLSARYYKTSKEKIADINVNALMFAFLLFLLVQAIFLLFQNSLQESLGLPDNFILLIPAFVVFRLLNTYVSGVWQIQHNVKTYGLFSIGTLLLDLLLSLLLVVWFQYGYKGRLIGSHLSFLIFSVIGLYLLKKGGFLSGKISMERIGEIVRFGGPLIPHALGGVSLAMAGRYLLANQLDNEAVGIYSVAYQVASVMLLVGTSINQAWSASLFRLLGEGVQKNRKMIKRLMGTMLALLVIACCSLFLFKGVLFGLLAGRAFDSSKLYFPYLLLGFFFQSVYFLFVNFDFYEERVGMIGFTTLFTALVNIALNLVLIPRLGILGAVYSAVASMALYLGLVMARVIVFNKAFRQVWFS